MARRDAAQGAADFTVTTFQADTDGTDAESLVARRLWDEPIVVGMGPGPFTGLPAVIFSYARLPGDDFRAITAAAALVLLFLVLLMNGFAIWLRNRYERKW